MREIAYSIGSTLMIVQFTLIVFVLFALIFYFPKNKIRIFLIGFFSIYFILYTTVNFLEAFGSLIYTQVFSGIYIFVNLIYSISMVLLITELVIPHWLTIKRAFNYCIMPLGICLLGGVYILISQGSFEIYSSYTEALQHINTFDFWWRIVSFFVYNYFQFYYFWKLHKAVRLHNNYVKVNLVNNESYSIKWIIDLLLIVLGLNIAYFIGILYDNDVTRIICNVFTTFVFAYLILKIFKPRDLYPPIDLPIIYTKKGWALNTDIAETEWIDNISDTIPHTIEMNREDFNALPEIRQHKLLENLEILNCWMIEKKPYLKADIRRDDLMILGMNSSDLNDLFKVGLQTTFPLYILHHRINEAKKLLINDPDMTIKEIAYHSGFSSPSVFSRSFQNYENMTPLQYRKNKIQ